MKKLLMTTTALLLSGLILSPLSFAESPQDTRQQKHLEQMQERLQLSAEQTGKIQELWQSKQAEREAHRQQMQNKMAEILTPEQMEKMQNWRESGYSGMDGKGGKKGKMMRGDCDGERPQMRQRMGKSAE